MSHHRSKHHCDHEIVHDNLAKTNFSSELDISQDDNIYTCKKCGTVIDHQEYYTGGSYNPRIKYTLGRNEIKSKDALYFRENRNRKELEQAAKSYGIKYIQKKNMRVLSEMCREIENSGKPIPTKLSKSRAQLRDLAKQKGVKYSSKLSKQDLVNKIHEIERPKSITKIRDNTMSKKTVLELRQMAKQMGIKYVSKYNKKDLIDKIGRVGGTSTPGRRRRQTSKPTEDPLNKKTIRDLHQMAKQMGVKDVKKYTKKDLIAQIHKIG